MEKDNNHYENCVPRWIGRLQIKLFPGCNQVPTLPADGPRAPLESVFSTILSHFHSTNSTSTAPAPAPAPDATTRELNFRDDKNPRGSYRVYYSDSECVVIRDHMPCAPIHLLVIPTEPIRDVLALRPTDIDLLKHMDSCGRKTLERLISSDDKIPKNAIRRFNYHVPPCTSVPYLHLHCIAGDLNLLGKLKFNHTHSYTSEFVMESLE